MAKSQDWKYVMVMSGATENPDGVTLTGPFEDQEAADEFCEDYTAITSKTPLESDPQTVIAVMSLDDADAVLAALKADRKAVRKANKKAAKKAAKVAKTEVGNGKTEVAPTPEPEPVAETKPKNGKGKKAKKSEPTPTEADASDVAAPSDEGAAPVPTAVDNGQPDPDEAEQERRREISEAARKQPWAGQLAEKKDEWIEKWARELSKDPVIGPLNLSPQQRRVIAALKWSREVAKSNAHLNAAIPPAPVVGMDANGRIVVQGFRQATTEVGVWAVFKNGNPADVKEPVTRLKKAAAEKV